MVWFSFARDVYTHSERSKNINTPPKRKSPPVNIISDLDGDRESQQAHARCAGLPGSLRHLPPEQKMTPISAKSPC